MDTHIVKNKDGRAYNQYDEEVISCVGCGRPTTMTGTELCDYCFNAQGIFNTTEKATLIMALNDYKDKISEYHVGEHFTKVDRAKRLMDISKLKKKIEVL